jgi:inorganic pyrophosphatase
MKTIEVIVETPRGSAGKYNYEPDAAGFRLKKMLPAGMVFPYDFGYIPGTLGEDGDPLDIMLISEFSNFPGCRIECRLIGGLKAKQTDPNENKKTRNDRFLAIPSSSVLLENVSELKDLPPKLLDELEAFFIHYNKMEGKEFEVKGTFDAREAAKMIIAAKK